MSHSESVNEFKSLGWVVELNANWLMGTGVLLLILGIFAINNVLLATSVTTFYVGLAMLVGGLLQILHSFQVKGLPGFFFFFTLGIIYAVAGVATFRNPLLSAEILTILLIVSLMVSGLARIGVAFQTRSQSMRAWTLASGLVSLLVGGVFVIGWPLNSLWLPGILLAVELTFQGLSAVALSLIIKNEKRALIPLSQTAALVR